jgi:hypothetical protein
MRPCDADHEKKFNISCKSQKEMFRFFTSVDMQVVTLRSGAVFNDPVEPLHSNFDMMMHHNLFVEGSPSTFEDLYDHAYNYDIRLNPAEFE